MSSVYDDIGWFDNGLTEEAIIESVNSLETKVSKMDDEIKALIRDLQEVHDTWKERQINEVVEYVDEQLYDILGRLDKFADKLY